MGENRSFLVAFSILLLTFAISVIMAVSMVVRAHAQEAPACPAYADVKKLLADEYGEAPAGSGILGEGNSVMMVFASPKGSTWTAALLKADGTACIMGHGSDWISVLFPEYSMKDRRPA